MNRTSQASGQVIRYAVSLAVLLAAWIAVVRLGRLPEFLLPQPSSVLRTLLNERTMFMHATAHTLQNAALGATIGISLGLVAGVCSTLWRPFRWIAEPYLIIGQSFPRESLLPLIVVWMGFGSAPKVVSAALLCFFPMAILTASGLQDTRKDYVELVRSWGASPFQELIHCRLPAAIPALVSALGKVCLPLALIGAVLGEMTGGGNDGLGYIIVTSGAVSRVDRIFGAIVVLGLIGTVMLATITAIQTTLRRFNQE